MDGHVVDKLVAIGFSEYEAKAYAALLRENPVTGYQLAKISSVPRSMIYEVLGKLTTRGAAMTCAQEALPSTLPFRLPSSSINYTATTSSSSSRSRKT